MWLPIGFCLQARWFRKSCDGASFQKLYASKLPTNMASKLLKLVCWKYCVDRLRFQKICRLNRRAFLSLLDLKEKCTRHAGVSTNEADFFDRHDHRAGQSKRGYYHTYLQSLACLWSRHKSQDTNRDTSRDVTPLQVKSSDELARSTKWRFENRK